MARIVTIDRLHFNDVSSKICQNDSGGGPHHHVRELNHPQAVQWLRQTSRLLRCLRHTYISTLLCYYDITLSHLASI